MLSIKLKNATKLYCEGDVIHGFVVIDSKMDISHNGIMLSLTGTVRMDLSNRTYGSFDAMHNSIKPINMIAIQLELAKPGKLPIGQIEIPFEIELANQNAGGLGGEDRLFETYRGVYINVEYALFAEIKRSFLNKSITTRNEILLCYKNPKFDSEKAIVKPYEFKITHETVTNVRDKSHLPHFSIVGHLESVDVRIDDPVTGWFTVETCDTQIKSIELQLIRIETCGCAEGYSKGVTEIENLQVAEGDVWRGHRIPLFLLLPRLFTCPTTFATNFKIEFELNLVIVFHDDHLVTEPLPLRVSRF